MNYFPTAAPDYCGRFYDLSEIWVSGMGEKSRGAYEEREAHVGGCAQCAKARNLENKCDRQGCDADAVEYVLLRAGSVHVCIHHASEAKQESSFRKETICSDCGIVSLSSATCTNCGILDTPDGR